MKPNRSVLRILGPAGFTLACLPLHAATVLFSDNFNSYEDGKADTAYQAAYNVPAATGAFLIASTTGLGGSKSLQNTVDATIVREDVSADLAVGAVTVSLYFQWGGSVALASPQIGLVGAFNGGFTGTSDIGGRVTSSTGTKLQIRSNNGTVLTDDTSLTLTTNSWYQLSTTVTRTTTTDQLTVLVQLYSSDPSGTITGLIDSISSNVTNANVWSDTSVFAALRENSSITNMDNFAMTQVPEPGAAFIGSLGMIALLRRRR